MIKLIGVLSLSLFAIACAGQDVYEGEVVPKQVLMANYQAADNLVSLATAELNPAKPIIIATVVDIDDLGHSSTLGRFISESVSARFTQRRYKMVEMKLQHAVYMKKSEGELMLTRQIREIASSHQAQAVIVGTYSKAGSVVFVNLKMVRPETDIVLAAQDYALPMSHDVCVMLYGEVSRCTKSN
jgi:TolB-like protein